MRLADSETWGTVRSASRVNVTRRNRAMTRAYREGFTVADIAHAARLSVSQTRRILIDARYAAID